MSNMLTILLPTTLPMEMSVACWTADVTETQSSGALVPKATIVRPMMSGETRHLPAIPALPSTNQSAPLTRSTNPTIKRKIQRYNMYVFLP